MDLTIAEHQHGLITLAQLRQAGVSQQRVARLVKLGIIARTHNGVYRICGGKRSHMQELMAVVFSYKSPVFVSHLSAAELHGLKVWSDSVEHFITLGKNHFSDRTNARIHRTQELPVKDTTLIEGIPATSMARTIIDLAEYLTPYALAIVVDDALQRKLVTLPQLVECYERVGRWAGRKRFRPIKEVLAERAASEKVESALERKILQVIRSNGLPIPELQYQFDSYRLDMAYPQYKVAIEVDGFAFHSTRESFDADRKRDNTLKLAGWNVVHFTANTHDVEVVSTLRDLLRLVG
jgi:very-short-patch-repair endonuclease